MSGKLVNDDPANPPSSVSFAITELSATVDAKTVFARASTTTYSPSAGGYTWSGSGDQHERHGREPGPVQVTSVAVATVAGVVGWCGSRTTATGCGVPVAENGPTID